MNGNFYLFFLGDNMLKKFRKIPMMKLKPTRKLTDTEESVLAYVLNSKITQCQIELHLEKVKKGKK